MLSQKEAVSEAALRVQAAEALALSSPMEAGEGSVDPSVLSQSSPPTASTSNGGAPLPPPPTFPPPPPPPPAAGSLQPVPAADAAVSLALPPASNAGAAFTRAGDVRDSQRTGRPTAAGTAGSHHVLLAPNSMSPDVPLDVSLNNSRNSNNRNTNPTVPAVMKPPVPTIDQLFQQKTQPQPPPRAQSYEVPAPASSDALVPHTSAQPMRGAPPALAGPSTIGAHNNVAGAKPVPNQNPAAAGADWAGGSTRQSSGIGAQYTKQLPPLPAQTPNASGNPSVANHSAASDAQQQQQHNRHEKQTHCCVIS